MTTASSDMTVEPKHYVKIFWRRKGVILLSVLTVFCSALVALSFMPDEYEANVALIFEEPKTPLPENTPQAPSGYREEGQLNKFASRIRSRPFLASVVQRLPMTTNPNLRAAAEEIYRKNPQLSVDEIIVRLRVERIQSGLRFGSRGSGIYEVVVADPEPQTAQLLAQHIGDLYIEDYKQQADEAYILAISWLEGQITLHRERVREAEEKLDQYQGSQIKESFSSAVRAENQSMAEALQRKVRNDAQEAERTVRARMSDLTKVNIKRTYADATLSEGEVNEYAEPLKESLMSAVDDRLVQALPASEPVWPPTEYRQLRQSVGQRLQEKVFSKRQKDSAATVDAIAAYLLARIDVLAKSEVALDLDKRIEDYEQRALNQPAQDLELEKLKRDVDTKRAVLEHFQGKEYENKTRQAQQNASLGQQVQILDPPQLPLSPSRPNRLKILLGALLLGTMLGLGLAFLSEIMDPTVRTLADIQRVAPEPILCTTPLLSKLQPRIWGVRRFWLPAAVSAVILLTAAFFVARMMVQEVSVPGAGPAGAATEASGR